MVRRYAAAAPTGVEVIESEIMRPARSPIEVFKGTAPSVVSTLCAAHHQRRIVSDPAEDLGSTSPWPNNLPVEASLDKLTGGRDGIDGITAEDFIGYDNGLDDRRGLMTLEFVDEVGVIRSPTPFRSKSMPVPEARSYVQHIHDAMIGICERSQDRFAILDAPDTRDIEEVRRMRQRLNTSFAAIYFPWWSSPVQTVRSTKFRRRASSLVSARTEQVEWRSQRRLPTSRSGLTQLTLPLSGMITLDAQLNRPRHQHDSGDDGTRNCI